MRHLILVALVLIAGAAKAGSPIDAAISTDRAALRHAEAELKTARTPGERETLRQNVVVLQEEIQVLSAAR